MATSETKIPLLSKSRFIAGLQCGLRLWHECYNPGLASEISAAQQAVFDTGHDVGELATRLYPGGIMIMEDHLHHEEGLQTTLRAMKDNGVPAIYEAAFTGDGVRIRADIIERLDHGKWNLIEVKSSTSIKDVYIQDVAVQYHILGKAGVDIGRAFLMHVNNQYTYDGNKLDLNNYFKLSDLTDRVIEIQDLISGMIRKFNRMLEQSNPPDIQPSRHCMNPYECEFWEYCTRDMPEHWVMELTGITQKRLNELMAINLRDVREIPEDFRLSALQGRIRNSVINNKEYIAEELWAGLEGIEYPLHFLDFETVGPAIPRYAGTRPYQPIPFQWSDHILYPDGRLVHLEYLCNEDKDPREEFIKSLIGSLGTRGSIFIYTNYESMVIQALALRLPRFSEMLVNITGRFRDLYVLIKKYYYHPGFHGSFSLKSVLPALVPEMTYQELAIKEGDHASVEYLRMINPATTPEEKAMIRKELLTYCGYDTLAMVRIREELLKKKDIYREG
jgi:hypothetical protein